MHIQFNNEMLFKDIKSLTAVVEMGSDDPGRRVEEPDVRRWHGKV